MANLIAFDKTDLLEPGKSQAVTIVASFGFAEGADHVCLSRA